jgi:hypothetical protein
VVAGTATAVSNRVSRRQAGRWAQQEVQEAPPPQQVVYQQAPPPAGTETGDVIGQLKELAALKEQGILTEEEFAAQKARILGN